MTSVLFHDPDEAAACLLRWTDAFAARSRRHQEAPVEDEDADPEARAENR